MSAFMDALLQRRGIMDKDRFFNIAEESIYDYSKLKYIDSAIDSLQHHIVTKSHLHIIGDYDVDGITSAYILKVGLDLVSDCKVTFVLPDRVTDGYGINKNLIDNAKEQGAVLLITCDNGITAKPQVAYAKSIGLDVLVTDHHDIPDESELPECVTVNPKFSSDCFVDYCGATVAFKVLSALYDSMGYDKGLLRNLIQYVAMATICDVVPLRDVNRDIVKIGLYQLSNTSNIGLRKLIECQGLSNKKLSPDDISYNIGPCLNAAGRLKNATIALNLLLSSNESDAGILASAINNLNTERKTLTQSIESIALHMAEQELGNVIVILLEECHESLAGIVAGNLVKKFNKPSFVITKSDGIYKGSARSIKGYNVHEELTKVEKYLVQFGGHELAAGFSLRKEDIPLFKEALVNNCSLTTKDIQKHLDIDLELKLRIIDFNLINELSKLEPYGAGNKKPLFLSRQVMCRNPKVIGKNKTTCTVEVCDNETSTYLRGIMFNDIEPFLTECYKERPLDICYNINLNEWRGTQNIQLVIQNYR